MEKVNCRFDQKCAVFAIEMNPKINVQKSTIVIVTGKEDRRVEADKSEVLKYYRINKDNKLYSLLGIPLSGCCTVEALNKIEQQGRERANVNNRIEKTSVRNHLKMI